MAPGGPGGPAGRRIRRMIHRRTIPQRSAADLELSLGAMKYAARRAVEILEGDIRGSLAAIDALLILRAALESEKRAGRRSGADANPMPNRPIG